MYEHHHEQVLKYHRDALSAIEQDMQGRRYFNALEGLRRILGDTKLPPEERMRATLQEVRALLGVGRPTEALIRLDAADRLMMKAGLRHFEEQVSQLKQAVHNSRRQNGAPA